MNDPIRLGRLLTAIVTAFDADGEVDYRQTGRIAKYLTGQGVDGFIVCGTTGESPTLSDDEKLGLFAAVKDAVGTSASVIAGTGNNNTKTSVMMTRRAQDVGADAILAVVPYYNKPTQDGMLTHFSAIAEATTLPIIVYNIPGRTGVNMQPATLLELARRHENIVGVKESSGNFSQFSAILHDRPNGFRFWCGDDYLFLPSLAIGADGLISVAAHLCAAEFKELLDAFDRGDVQRAAAIHRQLSPLIDSLFATTSPIPIKWALNRLGLNCGPCRSPLGGLPNDVAERLEFELRPYVARCVEVARPASTVLR